MVVVLDIGNTNIHLGLYEGETLVKHLVYPLSEKATEHKMRKAINDRKLEGVAIASVVPSLTPRYIQFFKKRLSLSPLLISPDVDCHLTFGYHKPHQLGVDRIATAAGGLARYKRDLVIINFGTATTLDIIFKNGRYPGGIITPGVETAMNALARRTALLKEVPLRKPIHLIGRSTEECIQSGIFNGTIALVRGLIQMIRKKYKKRFLCIATGGWSTLMAAHIPEITRVDPDLCLYGILKIYYYNV